MNKGDHANTTRVDAKSPPAPGGGYRRYHVSKRRIIPLPMYKVDPALHPEALFKPKQVERILLNAKDFVFMIHSLLS